jgi:hypothetical protein
MNRPRAPRRVNRVRAADPFQYRTLLNLELIAHCEQEQKDQHSAP